jgi:hypothetical protein
MHTIEIEPVSQVGQAMHDADAAINHLLELRLDPATRDDMADEQVALWRLKSNLEWLLTSIKIDREPVRLSAAE